VTDKNAYQLDKALKNITEGLEPIYDPLQYETGVPFALLGKLRRDHAVVWVDEHSLPNWPGGRGFWLVLRHREVGLVMKNPRIYSSWLGATQLMDPATDEDLRYVRKMMLNMDPPQHTRLRRLLQNSFTSRAVARLESGIQEHARTIFDRALGQDNEGQCDFAHTMAADMPLLSLADILGMPRQDRYLMYDWANRVIGFQDPDYKVSSSFDSSRGSDMARESLKLRPQPDRHGNLPNPRAKTGMPDLYRYAHLLAEHKRRTPGDDVMSILLGQVDDEGGQLSIEEFENMFWLFSVAGNETLRNGIPGGMLALLQNPQAMQQLRSEPEILPRAVDEMLRWWTPVMIFRRTATEDTTLGKSQIRAGDKVVVSFVSANRDETVFKDPDLFDINRSPNPHYSFGYGPHFCLGAQLARTQMHAIFGELLNRLEHIELAGEVRYLRSNFQRGMKYLPVTWRKK
jgi:cytochrome P450